METAPEVKNLTRWMFQRMTGLTDEEMVDQYDAENNSELEREVQDALRTFNIM